MEQSELRRAARRIRTADADLTAIRDHWIAAALSTAPADRERAEAGVRLAYRNAGLPENVRFIWAPSPVKGAITADSLVRRANMPRLPADVAKPAAFMPAGVADELNPDESAAIRRLVIDPIVTYVNAFVWRPIKQQVAKSVRRPIVSPAYGQHDALTLALSDVFRQSGIEVAGMEAAAAIAESCGWWWPFDDVCVLSERPSKLSLDACGQLHSASGPAVMYPDGWSIHAWNGVVVDPAVAQRPDPIMPAQIQRQAGLHTRTEIGGAAAATSQPPAIESNWMSSILRR